MNKETKRVGFTLSTDALAVLDRHTTERKRGEFVSSVLLEWEAYRLADESMGSQEAILATGRECLRLLRKLAEHG